MLKVNQLIGFGARRAAAVPDTFLGGALVYKTATQSINNNTTTTVTWGAEAFDTDGYWTSGDNTKLSAPVDGVYQPWAGQRYINATDGENRGMGFRLNGALYFGASALNFKAPGSDSRTRQNMMGPPVSMTAGQYITLTTYQQSGSSKNLENNSEMYFGLRRLDDATKIFAVRLSANESIANSSLTYVPWDTNSIDTTGGLITWSGGTPEDIVIDSSVSLIRVYAGARWTAATGSRFLDIDNGAGSFAGGPVIECLVDSGSRSAQAIASPVIPRPSDGIIRGQVRQNSGGALNLENTDETYLFVEIVA